MVTGADGTIRYISPSVERVLGYQPNEMVGTNTAEYVHPDDLEKGFGALAEALSKPGVHPVAVERPAFATRTAPGATSRGWRTICWRTPL
jgi:PAS domain S-box-containing protein